MPGKMSRALQLHADCILQHLFMSQSNLWWCLEHTQWWPISNQGHFLRVWGRLVLYIKIKNSLAQHIVGRVIFFANGNRNKGDSCGDWLTWIWSLCCCAMRKNNVLWLPTNIPKLSFNLHHDSFTYRNLQRGLPILSVVALRCPVNLPIVQGLKGVVSLKTPTPRSAFMSVEVWYAFSFIANDPTLFVLLNSF